MFCISNKSPYLGNGRWFSPPLNVVTEVGEWNEETETYVISRINTHEIRFRYGTHWKLVVRRDIRAHNEQVPTRSVAQFQLVLFSFSCQLSFPLPIPPSRRQTEPKADENRVDGFHRKWQPWRYQSNPRSILLLFLSLFIIGVCSTNVCSMQFERDAVVC